MRKSSKSHVFAAWNLIAETVTCAGTRRWIAPRFGGQAHRHNLKNEDSTGFVMVAMDEFEMRW
jgi:hypothetical protein